MADFIKESELYERYEDYKKFMLPLWQPLDEYERLARNKPHPGIDKSLPKVTDGTLASLIQEQPKRVIQQIPTGKVTSNSDWLDVVGNYILTKEILPNANGVVSLIQKCWALVSKSLTYGSQPAFVQFVNRGEYFGTDFVLPYVKDVLLEPGKLSDRDSNVIMLRTWWSPNQIDQILQRENKLTKSSKKRGDSEPYQSGWNLERLKQLKGMSGQKDQLSMTPNEKGKQLNDGFIEIVHVFQRGVGATFYSFSPLLPKNEMVVRTRQNKDPRGMIPIHFMYANVDLSNPLGRGSVEISGGMQNLLDSEVQSFQYMRALLMNPPLEIKGDVPSSIMKYAPAAQWRLGSDPNASVQPVKLETASLQGFPNNYGLIKSQILNLNNSTDTSVSAEVGNPGFSKTPQGVKVQQQRLGISDNYMRRQFESVFEEIAETMLNLYFAERSGTQELQVDDDTAAKLEKEQPGSVKDNKIRVDYSTETESLKFEVDATTSAAQDDTDERDRLVELLELSQKFPMLQQIIDQKELASRIVLKTGVDDPEKIVPVDDQGNPSVQPLPQQGPAPMDPQQVQQVAAQTAQEVTQKTIKNQPKPVIESLGMKLGDFSEDVRQLIQQEVLAQMGINYTPTMPTAIHQQLNIKAHDSAVNTMSQVNQASQDPNQLESELLKRGYTQDQVNQAMQTMQQGGSNQDVINTLHPQGVNNG